MDLQILYEDSEAMVIYKPAGVVFEEGENPSTNLSINQGKLF